MNRNALMIYLKNLRDLEFAKNKIKQIYNREQKVYDTKVAELKKTNYWKESSEVYDGGCSFAFFGILTLMLLICICFLVNEGMEYGYSIVEALSEGVIIFLIMMDIIGGVLTFAVSPIPFMLEQRNKLDQIRKHNIKERERERQNSIQFQNIHQEWIRRSGYLKREYDKVCSLLTQAYGFNILANQYRNLASVYYIYDYMSSSRASLNDTLVHAHMENGIQRILAKLDTIIAQNEDIILQNRQKEINDRERTEQILSSLNRIEGYGRDSAHNTKLAANYAEANAYFSLATYLKN